ncbi:MAG TPA: sterol desaturase family protein, partial [Polyangium sp.]|nr:sterol desaturase family protein [Polyangium sp.]
MDDLKNPAILAVPLYFALIWWEVRELTRLKAAGKDVLGYERRDTWASILVGAVSLITVGGLNLVVKILSEWLWDYRLTDLGNGVLGWTVALLGWDFAYYWLHRVEHESRILWSAHVNHHSSERYNLSTALRQPWTPVVLVLFF